MGRRAVALVDGEHHPPVVAAALRRFAEEGVEPVAAVYVGGGEKLARPGAAEDLGVPATAPPEPEAALPELLRSLRPDVVLDCSGEPVVSATRRLRLAAIALAAGADYEAPGLRYAAPDLRPAAATPSVAVVATGKRTGKTAMSGAVTRHAAAQGRTPVVVAMGRGGPQTPIVLEAGRDVSPAALLEVAAAGGHAASDFYEDAVTTGATTVGCFRVGDGPVGTVGLSNVDKGVETAEALGGDLLVLEGSGAALPPGLAGATALIVPATADPGDLAASLPLRWLLADVVLITFAGSAPSSATADLRRRIAALLDALPLSARPAGGSRPPVVATEFVPTPLGDVGGRRIVLVTTAPPDVTTRLATRLEREHGARVVAASGRLADRPRLREDLEAAPDCDAVVVELKAAAVDVVMRWAEDRGVDAVVLDHRPEALDAGIEEVFDRLLDLADERSVSAARHADPAPPPPPST